MTEANVDKIARADVLELEGKVKALESTVSWLEDKFKSLETEQKVLLARTMSLVRVGGHR